MSRLIRVSILSYLFFTMFLILSMPGFTFAQTRGIGVSPARIEIRNNAEWPHTASIFVTNYSTEKELFEITLQDEARIVSVAPGRFVLESREKGRVLITFEEPRKNTSGVLNISAVRSSPEGLVTGTGIKIPFEISGSSIVPLRVSEDDSKLLANVVGTLTGEIRMLFPVFMILVVLLLLWYGADTMRRFLYSSKDL